MCRMSHEHTNNIMNTCMLDVMIFCQFYYTLATPILKRASYATDSVPVIFAHTNTVTQSLSLFVPVHTSPLNVWALSSSMSLINAHFISIEDVTMTIKLAEVSSLSSHCTNACSGHGVHRTRALGAHVIYFCIFYVHLYRITPAG